MVIYLPNKHADPLVAYIKRALMDGQTPTAGEADALEALFKSINAEKNSATYRLWLREQYQAGAQTAPTTAPKKHTKKRRRR